MRNPSAKDMTLRDYFAAKAMMMMTYPGDLRLNDHTSAHFKGYTEMVAAAAYDIADAMLEAGGPIK